MTKEAPAQWWHKEENDVICDLCPHYCHMKAEGSHGICGLRFRKDDALWTHGWCTAATAHLDPVEKKPLYHFLPGTLTYSLGLLGCNLGCRHCQNWTLSAERNNMDMPMHLDAFQIIRAAKHQAAESVAFTYNEPLISAEFWIEVAQECHRQGLQTIAVTNGYANAECVQTFFSQIDAANVDLKSFSEQFYHHVCQGSLEPVLQTLKQIRALGTCHLEITTLLIPGQNDSNEELHKLSRWINKNLGEDTPLHFSAFHPDYKALEWSATSESLILHACDIAQQEGLHYVYAGNIQSLEHSDTICPSCKTRLIERASFHIISNHLHCGRCPNCEHPIQGIFP